MSSQVELNTFSTVTLSYEECCICLEPNDVNSITVNCCKQRLHKLCLLKWSCAKMNNSICPYCREEIKLNDVFIIDDILQMVHDPHVSQIVCKNVLQNQFNTDFTEQNVIINEPLSFWERYNIFLTLLLLIFTLLIILMISYKVLTVE